MKRDTLDSHSHLSWVTQQKLTELLLLGGSVTRGFQQMDKVESLQCLSYCLSERTLLPKGIPLRWYWLKLQGRSSFALSVRHCQVWGAAWQLCIGWLFFRDVSESVLLRRSVLGVDPDGLAVTAEHGAIGLFARSRWQCEPPFPRGTSIDAVPWVSDTFLHLLESPHNPPTPSLPPGLFAGFCFLCSFLLGSWIFHPHPNPAVVTTLSNLSKNHCKFNSTEVCVKQRVNAEITPVNWVKV